MRAISGVMPIHVFFFVAEKKKRLQASDPLVGAYAYCAAGTSDSGGYTLVLINFDPNATKTVDLGNQIAFDGSGEVYSIVGQPAPLYGSFGSICFRGRGGVDHFSHLSASSHPHTRRVSCSTSCLILTGCLQSDAT